MAGRFNYATGSKPTQMHQARPEQVKNNAGGFVFKLHPMKQLERFLILGSDAPTYYSDARSLTIENALVVQSCWALYPKDTMSLILSIAEENRAIKFDPVLFALALGTLDTSLETRQLVYKNLFGVVKTASQMFMFLDFCAKLGKGWGRGLKNAIATFYEANKEGCDRLGYQIVKYRQRNGFDHRRGLDLSHPKAQSDTNLNLMNFVWNKSGREDRQYSEGDLPDIVKMYLEVLKDEDAFFPELPWEAYPTDRIPWSALAPRMPYTALIRNLNKFNFKPLGELEDIIVKRLEAEKPNMHPFNILWGWKTYTSGRGFRGNGAWTVNDRIARALEQAYYNSFKYIEPTGERYYIGMDISGSMMSPQMSTIKNSNIVAGEAAMAMVLPILRSEPRCYIRGFSCGNKSREGYGKVIYQTTSGKYGAQNGLVDLPISKNHNLQEAIRQRPMWSGGATDCALPMLEAMDKKLEVDKFIIFTDNETWAGDVHPFQALKDYRKKSGINAKLIVCAMTSTGFTIADPSDEGMLDIVGCDSALPRLISSL